MPTNSQYEDHDHMLKLLKERQESEHDMREQAREAHIFVDKRDGQWEQYWWDKNDGKPRYTFDLCNPIIDQICGDIEERDFDIVVSPAGGDASKDTAEVFDGIIRNIENISGAKHIYNRVAREVVTGGASGWRVLQKYVDDNSFDQDLVLERIGNYLDRVWHGPHEEPDASDAEYCFVMTGLTKEDFEEKYPKRDSSASVATDKDSTAYYYRNDLVIIGEAMYKKYEDRELVMMSNNQVYEVDAEFDAVVDDLAQLGVTEVSRRSRKVGKVYSRLFDASGWINKPQETVFESWLPVVPCYGNHKVFDEKVIYFGLVEKLLDAQRVFNYSLSREVEEGALAPRSKYWMTERQAEGHEEQLSKMNTSADPVQFYNADGEAPGAPIQSGGAQINPGLRNISEAMRGIVGQTAGMFAANMGDNPGLQSGIAIEQLQDRGDLGNNKYITSLEIAQQHTGKILINAIPRVYKGGRTVRLLHEDGSLEMAGISTPVVDQQTGQQVLLNDLSKGTYDAVCKSGPSFHNRQGETVSALTEIGKVDPEVIALGGDILLGNIPSPGMDQIAERKRQGLFQAGLIPPNQLTDEEQQQQQAMAQQPPPEDPMMVAAKAEEAKAQADLIAAQTKQQTAMSEAEVKMGELKVRVFEAETRRFEAEIGKATALAEIKGKHAQAAKALAEAEAQDIENDMVSSGVTELMTVKDKAEKDAEQEARQNAKAQG